MIQPTRENFETARKGLIAEGYEHICTVMSGDKNKGLNYGTRFLNPTSHEVLWLNKDTLSSILFQLAKSKLAKHGYKLCLNYSGEKGEYNSIYTHASKQPVTLNTELVASILSNDI
ncbi:hypothetical protein [Synechococcus sp. PCC 6312]|uniref:hypothetical protein n=1 Tax=Synechococcus sp. (strain ATCC 27167 / PCC 6312) TaxID=195253 RepID=UPI00029EEA8A|nr:hypothetical protein [Synechococcus sp. PCC 6312]AFY60840.1 hypothetical protein Syn6312_1683 [Synechococcus sp. PCC 6312]